MRSHARCTRTVCAAASQQTRSKTTNAVEFERYIESRRSCRESSAAGGWMTADGRAAATERQRRATHRPVCSVALLRRPLTATATTLRPLAAHSLAVAQHLPSTNLLGAGCKVKSVNRFRRDFHHASVRSIGSDRDTTDMNAATRVFCRNALAELVPVLSYGACARVGGGPTRPDIGHNYGGMALSRGRSSIGPASAVHTEPPLAHNYFTLALYCVNSYQLGQK